MRLASLTLYRYGNYDAERICFDTKPGSVNILQAPNSAGKSVLRNAFADLLFGIHNQTPMGFRFGYPGMRVAAEILRSDGSQVAFSRRKVRGNTISDADGQPMDMALLHAILGGRDRQLLERLFVLDTEALRDGGKALLESGGDVASALLSAAGGIRQARALKQRLERQRDELAPVRRTGSRPFYLALEQFTAARRGGNTATLRPDEWFRQQRELDALEQKQQASNAAAETASAEISRLERIRRVRPALARHTEAASWLAANPDAAKSPPDLGQSLVAARLDLVTKKDGVDRAHSRLTEARREVDEVVVDADLLARAEQIELLAGEAGAARKARDDLPGVQGQYQHGLTRIRDLLRQLGSALTAERAIDVLPETALLARTRRLIEAHAEITASIRSADSQVEGLNRDLANVEQLLEDVPRPPDILPLESLLDAIRKDGDPAARLSEAEKALLDAQAALNAACARVPGWAGEASALAAIAPLTMDIYGRHEKELAAVRKDADAARQRHHDEIERLEQARSAVDAIAQGGTIPDEATLAAARTRRDKLWQLIFRRAFAHEPVDPSEEQSQTDGMPLPLAFERSISEADTIADRRYTESELLARIASARQGVTEAERRARAAAERARIAQEKLDQLRRAWAQICAALPIGDEPVLADIQAFISARERVIEASRRHDLAVEGLEALRRRHSEWATSLANLLDQRPSSVPALLAIADRVLSRASEVRDRRLRLETAKAQYEEQSRTAKAARSAQAARLETWRERWRTAMLDLARPESEEPEETAAVLEALREIAAEHREITSLADRITGMKSVIDRFTQAVRDLVQVIPGRLVPDEPFEAVRELRRRLNQERITEQRRRAAGEALERARADAEAAGQGLITAGATLRGILDLIGADTIEAAEHLLALSAERARMEAQSRSALAELNEFGDGFSVERMRTEVETISPDEVPARIDATVAARKEASESAQQIAEAVSALRQRMELEAADTNVNTAAAEQQAAIASLSRTLDEALVYHTASLLLGRALEVIERSGDSQLLQRLGTIFQALTGGAYSRVVTELDDGGTARLGLVQRDFPEERQSIDQLSEGTRDQLFLALRVAAIEDHLTSAEPLPFIGDDILQTFDDDRALAALRVLSDLSQHTQVIILTHHRHIPELAAGLPAGTLFQCQCEPVATTVG